MLAAIYLWIRLLSGCGIPYPEEQCETETETDAH